MKNPGISEVYSYKDMRAQAFSTGSIKYLLQKGYNHKLSGDILVNYQVGWMEHEKKEQRTARRIRTTHTFH